jgi:hypothetical protein
MCAFSSRVSRGADVSDTSECSRSVQFPRVSGLCWIMLNSAVAWGLSSSGDAPVINDHLSFSQSRSKLLFSSVH